MPLVSKAFGDIITFTRASTATYFDSAGVLQSAAVDQPRLDYDPATLAAQGLLIEEARTNSIRNNTMVGAAAGTPGTLPSSGWSVFTSLTGLTREIVAVGTENGITYIDIRLSGTPSAAGQYFINYETTTQVGASSGQNWTGSAYYKLQAGSLTGITSLLNAASSRNAVGADLFSATTAFTPTSAALNTQRVVTTQTNTPASTAFETQYLRLELSGAAIDITLRIGLPQLELGAFATSVIPTTTTALTRSADVASVNTLSPWFNASEGTIYFEGSTTNTAEAPFLTLQNGGLTDFFRYSRAFNQSRLLVTVASGTAADLYSGNTTTLGAVLKTAAAYKVNDFANVLNSGTPVVDTSGAVPTVTTLQLGSGGFLGSLGGYLRRITYYPRRLSNAELQSITT
jgi:hypothetical protein